MNAKSNPKTQVQKANLGHPPRFFGSGGKCTETISGPPVPALGHELVHVGQFRRKELTRLKYLIEAGKHGTYLNNKYERPAYAMEAIINSTLPAQMNRPLNPAVRCGCSVQ